MDKENGFKKNLKQINKEKQYESSSGSDIDDDLPNNDYEYEKNSSVYTSYFLNSLFSSMKHIFYLFSDPNIKTLPDKQYKIQEIIWKNELKEFQIHYKAYKNIPKCILYPLRKNGAIRSKSFFKSNLIWKLMKYDKMSKLIPKLNYYQRFNHFPCTWEIGRKDNMSTNFQRLNSAFPNDFRYVPETFVLPKDINTYMQKSNENKNKKWILKPVASSRGRGIKIITAEDKIPTKCLISNYIDNPHIINGKKYDLRIYVLVTNFSPLKIYMYNEGLTRFASEEYKLDDENKNKFMHLTNYSINKKSSNIDTKLSNDHELMGIKWSLSALKTYFKDNKLDYSALEKKICDIIVKSIITIADSTIEEVKKLTSLPNCLFELYGFDILVDDKLDPWLMEVNLNPSLDCEAQIDNKIKTSLITDIINMLGIIPYSRSKENKLKTFPSTIGDNKEFYLTQENGYLFSNEEEYIDYLADRNQETSTEIPTKYDQWETDIILYAEDELRKKGDFKLLFPCKATIDYYSKFILLPGRENIILWSWIKNKKKESLYKNEHLKKDTIFFDQ